MPRIHPSLIVRVDLDDRFCTEELILEVKRNYNHVAPTFIETVSVDDEVLANTMQYDIVLHRDYWQDTPEANELWENDLPEWLHNSIYKVSNNVKAQNITRCEHDEAPIEFAWVEVKFGDHALFSFATQEDSVVSQDAVGVMVRARSLMNAGVFKNNISCVRIPSWESYKHQREAALAERAEGTIEETDSAEAQLPKSIPFTPDATMWGIEYSDGTQREFNSSIGSFVN